MILVIPSESPLAIKNQAQFSFNRFEYLNATTAFKIPILYAFAIKVDFVGYKFHQKIPSL
jgi:hypothetical protein